MDFQSLNCPQCGGVLPRQAIWRTVACPYCDATVTRSDSIVDVASFHEALQRFQNDSAGQDARCGERRYRILRQLYIGASSRVMLARRCGRLGEHVVLKFANAAKLEREHEILRQLQADTSSGSAYFSQRLPESIALGPDDNGGTVLVLRHPPGYWGSLAEVHRQYGTGLDARHVVWMWRRVLEVLAHVHSIGWSHGAVSLEHMLVHPADHGVFLVGWSRAQRHADQSRDLMQSAWSMRALLAGQRAGDDVPALPASVPAPLAEVLQHACSDAHWLQEQGAAGLHYEVTSAAAAAFGPPRFLHFQPTP
ncbi:MAG TPA: protein kinase family protein [Pseudoduganella sp.]